MIHYFTIFIIHNIYLGNCCEIALEWMPQNLTNDNPHWFILTARDDLSKISLNFVANIVSADGLEHLA